jgi:hypothetical protein
VISLLDTFEEFGTLSLDEWNLTDILKSHVITLPENQKAYWKERGKINWVKLGDGNTKFFHTRATINYRKRYISTLKDETNNDIAYHVGIAEIIWNAFKEIMGKSDCPKMHFNLQEIYENSTDNNMRDESEIPFLTH